MTPSTKRLALSSGLALALGFAFTPTGCWSSGGGLGSAVPGHGDAEVPEGVARQLRTCALEHIPHLGSAERSVSFDVKLASNGQVDSVALRDSTLGDEDLEACMARAIRSLSEADLPMRRSESLPRGPVTPESRALLGQVQALECLASPPCLLTVGILIGVAYIAVQIYVQAASQSSTAKPKPRTAPTATAIPTATAMPAAGDEDDPCQIWLNECLENMDQPAWNQKEFGSKKDCGACARECRHKKGKWPDYKCPRN